MNAPGNVQCRELWHGWHFVPVLDLDIAQLPIHKITRSQPQSRYRDHSTHSSNEPSTYKVVSCENPERSVDPEPTTRAFGVFRGPLSDLIATKQFTQSEH